MKVGDKIRITDGSYAMLSDNEGCPKDVSGTVLINEGVFKVTAVGCFNFTTDCDDGTEVNDVECVSVKCPDRKVWTQARFCYHV